MNSHISEEYFPQSTGNKRMQIKQVQDQEGTSNQPYRNNFMKSILKQNVQNNSQTQNVIFQSFRNQSSPSPQCNQQKAITGRRLDNQSISINTNSSSTRMLQIQKLPLMNESSRKRMNSDTESSMFTNRNLLLPVEQNQAEIQAGDNISIIKCESARVSQKTQIKAGQNFFSSVKKAQEKQTEYQLYNKNDENKNGIIQTEYEQQQNQIINHMDDSDKVENSRSSNLIENKQKNANSKKNLSPNKLDNSKKDIKKRIEVKKEMLAQTLSPNTTNNSKQISTNDGSNKENMEQILQSQELIQHQQQQMQQQPQQQQQQQLEQNNLQIPQKQTKKLNRKSASQTFSPTQIKHIQKLLNNKEPKKKKKNQLFLYSNLSSPKQIAKMEVSGTISSKGQHLISEIATPNNNNQNLDSQNIQQDYQNGKSKISNSLVNETQEQNKYLQAIYQNQNYQSQNGHQNPEQKSSQQSSVSDLVMSVSSKSKNKKNPSNGNGLINQNLQINQNRQASVNKKIAQNSSNSSLHVAHKKQNSISNILKIPNEGNISNSPLHKTHRHTASLQISSNQHQIQQVLNQELKRQKSEDFLLFINENATKIQKEIEDKKKKEEEEKQKKLVEKALLKQKNETIRQKNLMRYTLKNTSVKNKQQNQQQQILQSRNQNDTSKKISLLFKNVQVKHSQLLNQTQSRSMLKSPKNQKKIDPKQRRINLGLECLNQLNESTIQSLIHNQKLRATQSVHLKDESKRAFSPEEKKQIQEFMFIKKKQLDQDIENKKKDKLMKQQKLRLNLESLKNEIKEQISSCKSSKGGFNQNSNNLSNGQQNSSSKKAKSTSNRHFKSLTFSAPQFDNLVNQNSLYISQMDTNKADQFCNNDSINNLNQQDDQVFDYLYEEYKRNFNWRDQLEQNLHQQSLQNFHQSCSQFSNQKDESILYHQNKQLTSSSNQKSLSNRKKSNRSQSQKMEYNYQKQVSEQYYNNQNQFNQNKFNEFGNVLKPQRLQFQIEEDKAIQNDNQHFVISQQLGINADQDYLYHQQQQGFYQQYNAQQEQEFLQRKNQIYVQYTKLSQRIQKQIFKNLKEQKQINSYQNINQQRDQQYQHQNKNNTQSQIYKQYSNRDKIQEIEEELYEQNEDYDEVSPHVNAYDIPNQYYHENEKSEEQKKLLNESFERDQNDNKTYSLSIQNQQSSNQNSVNTNQKYLQQDESAKLDYSNNMNKYDLYKLTELSSIKNSSVAEAIQKKTENSLVNNKQPQQNEKNGPQVQNQQQFVQNKEDTLGEENINDQKNNQIRQKSKSEQVTSNQNYDSPSQGKNLVDEIPTIQSDASSEFQAQYENPYQSAEEGYNNSYGMNEEELEEYMYYNIAAIYIQKVWRGFYTRKLLRDFFLELEEMYENQEKDEYQKSVLTEKSQNQQNQLSNQTNKNSQEDQLQLIQNINGIDYDSRSALQIQQNFEQADKVNQFDQHKLQGNNQQIKQGYDFNSAKIVETMGSSDDNIQPILIDLSRKKESKEQSFPLKNTTLQQKVNTSPQKNQESVGDESQFKNNSGGKTNQNTESQIQNQNKSSSVHKNDLESLISNIDLNQKDQKLKNETLQMQEINEFSKSLLTLKDFEKSTENKYPSKTLIENGMKLSDENQITDSQYYDTPLNQQLIQDLNVSKKNDNFSLNQNMNLVKDKFSEGYQKIKEDQINKWSELISDLQKLQNQPNSQIDSEQIKKLCQKYENNKNQLIDQYQSMLKSQEGQAAQENSSSLNNEKQIKDNNNNNNNNNNEIIKVKQNEIFESSPIQKQKSLSKNSQGVLKRIDKNSQLSNMKLALGSEQLFRDQSAIAAALSQSNLSDQYEDLSTKNQYSNKINGLSQSVDFNENRHNKSNKKKQQVPNYTDYVFEKLPSRDFASGKFNRLMLKKESMDELIKMREEIITYQKEAKLQIINQMFEQKKIPLQVYQTKLKECELWASKEFEKLQINHHEIERGWRKFAETIKQTKRGIEFMKQIKKIDYNKILANSQDDIKFSRLLSFRSDSEVSESDVFSERKEYNSQLLNLNNLKNLSGVSQGNSAGLNNCISPSNIKIVDQYQLTERPKKYINQQNQGLSLLQNGSIKGTNSINNYLLSKSCTSWDGNILNTNNSEEVEFDDINDYLKKIKNNFARNLSKQQLYGFQQQQNQNNQQQPQNSLYDESSSVSPQQSRSNTPSIKNGDESNNLNQNNSNNQVKKDEVQDQNKMNNFEISPNPKQKLLTQMTITQQSESDLKKVGLMSLESASSSVQSQSSEAQFSQHLFEYENAKKLQQEKKNGNIEDHDEQANKQLQQSSQQKQIIDQPNKELMSIEQKANIVSDKIIENLIDEVNNEIYEIKQKEGIKQQAHYTENNVHPNINEVMPTNIEYKNQFDEKVIPIESCANLNSIKDFLVALAEFIKENFREEFLGRINLPLGIDPLEFLKTFNITENTEPQDTETSNAPIYPLVKYIHVQKPVVSEEIFLTFNELYQRMIRRQKKLENRELYFEGQEEKFDDYDDDEDIDIFNSQSDIEKYNLKLIFDCFNEALDFLRPFSLGGKPLPWKLNQKKLANLKVKDMDIERVLGMAIGRTLKWGSCLCGFIPEKIEFPPGQDEENNEYLNQIKEDRLAQMLENEVLENEHKWLIYEEEETDVQLEIADDIFHSLMSETAQWLYLKMQGKLELMDVLQINVGRDQKVNFDEMIEDEEDQKQLLDYQATQDDQINNTQSNLNKLGAANILTQKRFKNSNEINIHANIEHLYSQTQNEYLDDDNLIVNLDNPSNHLKRKKKAPNQNHTSEDEEYNEFDDSDNYENDYFSNKKTTKVKEEISQKRRQGKQEEIQSKQNEKLIFQHRQLSYSPSNQYNQFQQSPVEYGDIQQKYNQIMGSTNSKASSLNSSF
ncbi:hypothetical protein ABPG74_003445 [Tetrahymena malaccensis]